MCVAASSILLDLALEAGAWQQGSPHHSFFSRQSQDAHPHLAKLFAKAHGGVPSGSAKRGGTTRELSHSLAAVFSSIKLQKQ